MFLDVSEKEVIEFSEKGILPTYKIAGVYLRFKRQEVEQFKKRSRAHAEKPASGKGACLRENLGDFFYFNDFYIVAGIVIITLFFIILRKY